MNKKVLREGVTTGTCAAAAAKAAAMLALTGECPPKVEVESPTGRRFILDIVQHPGGVCGVVKDAGDDPDATDGMTITASVEISDEPGDVTFVAGCGVGTVTLPGLKIPPGEPAINPVPREMITRAVREAAGDRAVKVTISAPDGETVAKRTFNPRLGITGGISILGTTGIVKPMDEGSIFASLTLELNILLNLGVKNFVITFGNTGETAIRSCWGYTGRCIIQAGNYTGYVLDEAAGMGFESCFICGHPGKLLKIAAGSFYTHNRTADGRLEALCTQAAIAGASAGVVEKLYNSRTTENAMAIIEEEGLCFVWERLAYIVAKRCTDRSFGELPVEAAFIDNNGKLLGTSVKGRASPFEPPQGA